MTLAAAAGHTEVVALLVKKGGKVEKENAAGHGALGMAAWYGKHDTVKQLLSKQADVTHKQGKMATKEHPTELHHIEKVPTLAF